jgi:hypothetical protein
LAKLECSLSLMKGVREKARAGIVLEGREKVWPRNTLLQKLGEMSEVSCVKGRYFSCSHG